MKERNDIVKSIVVLVLICLLSSSALAVVNHFTAPVSKTNAEAREQAARLAVCPEADRFEAIPSAVSGNVESACAALDAQGAPLCYLFTVNGRGFGGTIQVLCAVDPDGYIRSCTTMDVSSETSTLGGQTAKESYTAQYQGKDETLSGISAVSGATITSTAYEGCVREALAAFRAVKEAEQ